MEIWSYLRCRMRAFLCTRPIKWKMGKWSLKCIIICSYTIFTIKMDLFKLFNNGNAIIKMHFDPSIHNFHRFIVVYPRFLKFQDDFTGTFSSWQLYKSVVIAYWIDLFLPKYRIFFKNSKPSVGRNILFGWEGVWNSGKLHFGII